MKRVLVTALAVAIGAWGVSYEHHQLYKDPRIMGMGGAGIALGGSIASMMINPAGLARIPASEGWDVNILNLSVATNENIIDMVNDLSEANDEKNETVRTQRFSDVIATYTGDNGHFSANGFMAAGKKFEQVGFGLGLLGSGTIDLTMHQGFGSEGVVDATIGLFAGPVVGFSYDLSDLSVGSTTIPEMSVGAAIKYMNYQTMSHAFSLQELTDSDLKKAITDTYLKEGGSVALDLGLIAPIIPEWSVGMSLMNIGGLGDKEGVYIPMTLSIGVAWQRSFDYALLRRVAVAADYVDLMGEYEDQDYFKRTRLGAEAVVVDNSWAGLSLRAGVYQGYWSAGAELRLALLKIALTSYGEEIGAYQGQREDRRTMVNLMIGW